MPTTIKSGMRLINQSMRKIEIKDAKLSKILEERGLVFREVGKINEQLYALDKERTKLGYKMERLKEKTQPIVDKLTPSFELQEFEIISRVYINENRMPEVEIVDLVEEYKNNVREDRKKKK